MFVDLFYLLIHLLIYFSPYSFIYCLFHWFLYSFSLVYLFICSFIPSFIYLFIYLFLSNYIYLSIYSYILLRCNCNRLWTLRSAILHSHTTNITIIFITIVCFTFFFRTPLLIATDVAARGLDIPQVEVRTFQDQNFYHIKLFMLFFDVSFLSLCLSLTHTLSLYITLSLSPPLFHSHSLPHPRLLPLSLILFLTQCLILFLILSLTLDLFLFLVERTVRYQLLISSDCWRLRTSHWPYRTRRSDRNFSHFLHRFW